MPPAQDTGGTINDTISDTINDTIKLRYKSILQHMLNNSQVSKPQLAAALQVSTSTISRDIKYLQSLGFIRREGSNKSGHWVVNIAVNDSPNDALGK